MSTLPSTRAIPPGSRLTLLLRKRGEGSEIFVPLEASRRFQPIMYAPFFSIPFNPYAYQVMMKSQETVQQGNFRSSVLFYRHLLRWCCLRQALNAAQAPPHRDTMSGSMKHGRRCPPPPSCSSSSRRPYTAPIRQNP